MKIKIIILLALIVTGCSRTSNLPTKSSPQYNELVRTFYIGLAALQVGHDVQADGKLAQFTQLAPSEPAGWANWGLLALRQRNYDQAAERLHKARDLAPNNGEIHYLIGLLESSRGNPPEAINELRKSVELDQNNLIAIYKLAEEVERQGDQKAPDEVQTLIQKILSAQPDNIAALVELSRIAAKRGDTETLKSSVAKIVARSSAWPEEARAQVTALDAATQANDAAAAATRTSFLRNVLVRVPEYQRNLAAIKPPPGEEATPLTSFLTLEAPEFKTAAADTGLTFKPEPLSVASPSPQTWIGAISLSSTGAPVIATASTEEVRLASGANLPFPGGTIHKSPTKDGVLAIDFNYDFKTDLVLAGAGGLRFFRQDSPSAFTDVTSETKLSAATLNRYYLSAWTADIEADGDLDILVEAGQGAPQALRNNGDGTFLEMQPFAGVSTISDFAWADLDADGDPDAAIVDGANTLHIFSNERQGQFTERSLPNGASANANALNVMDVDNDGVLDLLVLQTDGIIARLSDKDHGADWVRTEIARSPDPKSDRVTGPANLKVADLDNNGGLDLVVMSSLPFESSVRCTRDCTLV
ncbi:MAG TPA: FG-GAP-like repeat-containing protein, partial [Pyrinomonadaceae bacterium]|nr:FG-GAP-like repeat-containing protein [Pyrinomonadaceae bacterium]